jgi:hypothetical protein
MQHLPKDGWKGHSELPPFVKGERVEVHPGTDLWMRGARFGTVEKCGRKFVHVNMDKLGRVVRIHWSLLLPVH